MANNPADTTLGAASSGQKHNLESGVIHGGRSRVHERSSAAYRACLSRSSPMVTVVLMNQHTMEVACIMMLKRLTGVPLTLLLLRGAPADAKHLQIPGNVLTRHRVSPGLLQLASDFLATPCGKDAVALRGVVESTRLILLHKPHRIHPAERVDERIESALPQLHRVQQLLVHANTCAATSKTPRTRTWIRGPALRAAAIKRSSHVASRSAPATSALATWRASKFFKP